MRCETVRDAVLEGQTGPTTREHLDGCPACRDFARDWDLLQSGFKFLAAEVAPEPSWGFVTRVLRRLDDSSRQELGFLEHVGRRVVYAAGVLALLLLMALVVPPSGPFRALTAAELPITRIVASAESDPVFAEDFQENQDLSPLAGEGNGVGTK